jgi:uncharacterized membrane protein YciS (DUF1049 family)
MSKPQIDETTRVNLPLRLLWAILIGVGFGGFWLAATFNHLSEIKRSIASIERKLESFNQRIEDHERRLIKIETKAGIVKNDTR